MRTITRAAFHESSEARRQFGEKTASFKAWLSYWKDIRGVSLPVLLARVSVKWYSKAMAALLAVPDSFASVRKAHTRIAGKGAAWKVRTRRHF